jgi:hypothetical protein
VRCTVIANVLPQIVRFSALMCGIFEFCEHPQCEQKGSPPRIGTSPVSPSAPR